MSAVATAPRTSRELSSVERALILLLLYSGVCAASWWFAYLLRFDFNLSPVVSAQCWRLLPAVIATKLFFLLALGQFGSLLSYFSLPDAQKVFAAALASALLFFGLHEFASEAFSPPRAVILSDFIVSFTGLTGMRLSFRMLRERFQAAGDALSGGQTRRIGVIGAGDVGAALVKDFRARPGLGMRAVAFGDDNREKWRTSIHGVQVIGSPEFLIEKAALLEIDEIVIAMPSAPARRIRELVAALTARRLKFERVPSMEQLVRGNVRVSQLRPVGLQDLLGREPVDLATDRIRQLVAGKVVMVTGAGGSIGGELCRQIGAYGPRRLLLVERCEVQMFQIEQELLDLGCGALLEPLVADILDAGRMRGIFDRFRPEIVFHAAAHKHVPMMEHQPYEAFRNNTLGTKSMAELAIAAGVERFVFISTDKAINPTNAMGATKRLAELYLQARQREPGTATRCLAVRFGNVLGSSGSVIPTFRKQISAGGPVTVTHPEVTRYFMTIEEAVGLVLQSATLGQGGEIFVLDMGKLVKIADVARQLIELSGLKPEVDIEVKFTGLRPGEKLFEEVNHRTENMVPTDHPKIMRFVGEPLPLAVIGEGLQRIQEQAATMDPNQVKLEMQRLVPEYQPYLTSA